MPASARPKNLNKIETERLKRVSANTRTQMQKWFETREKRKQLSKVHAFDHVSAVGSQAGVLAHEFARKQGMSASEAKRVKYLAESAETLHDIVRRATERKPHGVEGKDVFLRLAKRYPNFFEFKPEEITLIADAIELHELPYEEVSKRLEGRSPAAKMVAQSVQIADKVFEASGYRVLERRSFFVGKERLAQGKDLNYLKGLYGNKAPLFAVAMESCMRLRGINYLPDVEKAVQPIAKNLHAVQERFYLGLVKGLGFRNESELLNEMKRINFPKVDKMGEKLQRSIVAENERVSQIRVTPDMANSAAELVTHFSQAKSPEEAIITFNPRGAQAKKWLNGIKGYRNASQQFMSSMQRQVRAALKA